MLEYEPRDFLKPCLLLLINERPDHGYDLVDRLRAFAGSEIDAGGVYRALRALEHQGLVVSSWRMSTAGPARRTYHLTAGGLESLKGRAAALEATRDMIDDFLKRYAGVVGAEVAEPARAEEREQA
ncbi:MAG TPA: helix-turn-helix transcriptional regulator [Cryptosporangiaceae bacterium]|nr:helix-turn-helix transcriptional regulator [Cryptosporangiaceae bacterium]